MSKVKIEPITEHEKQNEISRASKMLDNCKKCIHKVEKSGKEIFTITRNGIIITTTDINKWNNHFNNLKTISNV